MEASATFTARTSDRLRRIGRALVDGVLPPRCLSCGEIVEQPDALCSRCWSGITFFVPPWCVLCGLPFPHPMGEDAVCGECARVLKRAGALSIGVLTLARALRTGA